MRGPSLAELLSLGRSLRATNASRGLWRAWANDGGEEEGEIADVMRKERGREEEALRWPNLFSLGRSNKGV